MEVCADVPHGFDVTAEELEVDTGLHFLDGFVETAHSAKNVQLFEVEL